MGDLRVEHRRPGWSPRTTRCRRARRVPRSRNPAAMTTGDNPTSDSAVVGYRIAAPARGWNHASIMPRPAPRGCPAFGAHGRPSSRSTVLAAAALGITVGLTACGANATPVNTIGKVAFDRPLAIPPVGNIDDRCAGTPGLRTDRAGGRALLRGRGEVADDGVQRRIPRPHPGRRPGREGARQGAQRPPEATTVHWHGMHLPAVMDGGPHQPIAPGGERVAELDHRPAGRDALVPPAPARRDRARWRSGLAGMFILRRRRRAGAAAAARLRRR